MCTLAGSTMMSFSSSEVTPPRARALKARLPVVSYETGSGVSKKSYSSPAAAPWKGWPSWQNIVPVAPEPRTRIVSRSEPS